MNDNPKISVIVPVYNAEKSLDRCIKSIYAQTFTDYEIILVNDGSKDNSSAICRHYAEKDNRIKVIDKENEGSGSARNTGIDEACGEYIYFCDADDEISSNLLQQIYFEAKNTESDLVIFSVHSKVIDSNSGKVIKESLTTQERNYFGDKQAFRKEFSRLYYEGVLFGGPINKLFKREIIKNENIRFPNLRRGQDEIFNMRYYRFVNSCSVIPDALYTYYQFDESGKNKKYRPNYFEETTRTYFITLKNLLDEFCANDEYTEKKFQNSFVYSMESAALLAFNPLEKLNRKGKIEFITSVVNTDFVAEILQQIVFVPDGYEEFWKCFASKDATKIYRYISYNENLEKLKKPLRKVKDAILSHK